MPETEQLQDARNREYAQRMNPPAKTYRERCEELVERFQELVDKAEAMLREAEDGRQLAAEGEADAEARLYDLRQDLLKERKAVQIVKSIAEDWKVQYEGVCERQRVARQGHADEIKSITDLAHTWMKRHDDVCEMQRASREMEKPSGKGIEA